MFEVVTVPMNQVIRFPNRCVVCEKPHPGDSVDIDVIISKWNTFELVFALVLDTPYASENSYQDIKGVPACKECAEKLKKNLNQNDIRNRIMLILATLMIVGLLIIEIGWLWKFIGFLVIAITVLIIYGTNIPAVDTTVNKQIITFYFKSPQFAEEFRQLNKTDKEN